MKKSEWYLNPLLNPESVAIIGCSGNLERLSGKPLYFLQKANYKGNIYPVNPKYQEIGGLKCYPNIKDIQQNIDAAIIMLPAHLVEDSVAECIEAGVGSIVLMSSGFAELGGEGMKAQERIKDMVDRAGIPLIGPNCLGAINFIDQIPLSFTIIADFEDVKSGGLAVVSQSGAFASWLCGIGAEQQVGFSYWITTGNEAGTGTAEIAKHLINHPNVTGVLVYLEELRDLDELMNVGRLSKETGKPVICLKVGRSEAGQRAALSHTGALSGIDMEYDAIFRKAGIIRAQSIEELLAFGVILSDISSIPKGNRVAIVTISGGGGIMAADICEANGLDVPLLSEELQSELAKVVPLFGSTRNPVDVTAEMVAKPQLMSKAMNVILNSDEVDAIVIFIGLQNPTATRLANDLSAIFNENRKQKGKPVVLTWMAATHEAIRILRKANAPVISDIGHSIKALSKITPLKREIDCKLSGDVTSLAKKVKLDKVLDYFQTDKKDTTERIILTEYAGKQFLKYIGVPIPKSALVGSCAEAVAFSDSLGYPVVAKISSVDILHKSDAGAVVAGIKDRKELQLAYETIMTNCRKYNVSALIDGVLIEEMISDAVEAFIGFKYSPTFGPMIMFGLGGIFVEIYKDVSIRVAPVTEDEAVDMINEIKGATILKGVRGKSPRDIEATAKTISLISAVGAELDGRLQELDINPLFILPEGQGVVAGDALFTLK